LEYGVNENLHKSLKKLITVLDNIDLINYIIDVSPPRYIKLFKVVYYD